MISRRTTLGLAAGALAAVAVRPAMAASDPIIVNEILIDQPEFNYETRILSSNIKDLLKNIEGFTGGDELVVVPGVVLQLVLVDVNHIGAHSVHEILRVRNHKENLVPFAEVVFKPHDGLHIQVVRGLIE